MGEGEKGGRRERVKSGAHINAEPDGRDVSLFGAQNFINHVFSSLLLCRAVFGSSSRSTRM